MAAATNGSRIVRPYYRVTVSGSAVRRFAAAIGCEDPAKSARLAQFTGVGGEDNLETVYVADVLPTAKRLTGCVASIVADHCTRG